MRESFSLRTISKKVGLVMFGIAIHICGVKAQNSVGIGTAAPNQRAVLELVSPNGDQGFLLPRMTTNQRTAASLINSLSTNENGMIVYDSDLGKFFYWQVDKWVAGLGAFSDQAGGDLEGTYPNPIIRQDAVDSDKILDGSILGADISNTSVGISKIDAQGNTSSVLSTDLSGNPQWIPQTTFATNDLPNAEILIGDNTNTSQSRPVSGDISLANDGTATILPDAIGSAEIADETLTSNDIADDAIGESEISTGAVTSDEILDASIEGQDIANETITSAKITNATIIPDDIASGGNNKVLITTAAGTVFWENINLFETSNLPEGNIFLGDVSNNAAPFNAKGDGRILVGDGTTINSVGVSGDITLTNSGQVQINSNTITDIELADNAVDNLAIQDQAVTTSKLVDNSVTGAKIQDNTIDNADLADNAVDTQKIDGEGNSNALLTTDVSGNPQWVPQSNYIDSNLPNAEIFIGNTANTAQPRTVGGDISLSNTGDTQINTNVVGTNEVIDNSITLDDIGPNAVAASELADNSVDAGAVQNNVVSVAKMDSEGNTDAILTTDGSGNPQWETKTSLDADPTNELQDLSLAGNILSLSGDATAVDLSGYLDNTDAQDLSLTGNTLNLTNDGTGVDLSGYLDNSDSQNLSNVLGQGNDAGGVKIANVANPTNPQDVATKNYVDGLTSSLTNGSFLIGDATNTPQERVISGDITISNTGVATIVAGAISGSEIGNNSITGAQIAPNTITSSNIASGSINSGDIENGGIATVDLGNGIVNSAKIADGSVKTSDMDGEGNLNAVLTTDGSGNPQWEAKSTLDTDNTNELITGITLDASDILTITEAGTNHTVDLSLVAAGDLSDRRLKKDITPLLNSLEAIKQLNGYTYYWKDKSKSRDEQIGVIAQEVEKLYPQLVITGEDGIKKVNYIGLIPILIEAMKEQQMMIDQLLSAVDKKEIDTEQLKNTLKKQSELFKKQKKLLGSLQEENYQMRSDIELIKMSLGLEASSEK